MLSLVNDLGKTPEGENLTERDIYYSWTMLFADLQSLSRNTHHTTQITEPKNQICTSKTTPWEMCWPHMCYTDNNKCCKNYLPQNLCDCTTVWNPYGLCSYTLRNCTNLYETVCTIVRNSTKLVCTAVQNCTDSVHTMYELVWTSMNIKLFPLKICAK